MDWVFVAMPKEARHLKNYKKNVIITGIGVRSVIETLSIAMHAGKIKEKDRIINVGYCGSKKFAPGSVVSINVSDKFKKPKAIKEKSYKLKPLTNITAKCYTFDDFEEEADCDGVMDMELFYLASFFPKVQSIKVVSDCGNYEEYKKNIKKQKPWDIVNSILEKELKWKQ